MKTRKATQDKYDGQAVRVCVSCHKLPKFCKCGPDAVATCPICSKPESSGKHFPEIDCSGKL